MQRHFAKQRNANVPVRASYYEITHSVPPAPPAEQNGTKERSVGNGLIMFYARERAQQHRTSLMMLGKVQASSPPLAFFKQLGLSRARGRGKYVRM